MTEQNPWQSKELAEVFLNGVRGAIPGSELQLAVLAKVAQLWRPTTRRILDLGCGDGILGRFLLERFPEAQAVFVDFSEPMLQALRERLAGHPRGTITRADFGNASWRQALPSGEGFDLVVSGFAIHHQPDGRKRQIYEEIHELLVPGGVFLNLEHVASETPAGEKLFNEFFIDSLLAFHTAGGAENRREEIADAYYNRPDKIENILAPVSSQCDWLRRIGFIDVDCFLKLFELALFGGRKNPQ
jgi:tRNA (cmo5U34)-methyltransferase